MQMSYCLYWRLLVDLAYLKEPVGNAFLVVSFTLKIRHFQPSVTLWKVIKHMASKEQFIPEKSLKIHLNSNLLIECQN